MLQKEIYDKINKLLWEEWNPIGVSVPEDEYSGYVPSILRLKMQNADEQMIARKMLEHEKMNMGLEGNYKNCLEVAKKIIAL